jgi:hypothetical protein
MLPLAQVKLVTEHAIADIKPFHLLAEVDQRITVHSIDNSSLRASRSNSEE